tara:strand:- start:3329 stop:3841 length:513 start_codon:yes stop_codon:yes gene_type:complete
MLDNEVIEGLDQINRKLSHLEAKSADKVLSAMIRGQMKPIEHQMKKDVDSQVKEGRKGVRSRFKNKKKKNFITAKVGFGVGKKQKAGRTLKLKGNRREGQGISAQNIHWWVAGTKTRQTKRNVDRGAMPSMQPGLAAIAATKSRGKQNAEMIKRGALALEKEVLKLRTIG